MVGDIGINVVPRITVAGYVEADLVSAFLTEDHLGSSLVRSFAYDFILP
jgi:hypothetical protein